ncbi:MAG: hotdog fold thioesterase [Saprospiraceae bacterium]|nr:hotdog fold thioesterase [Saprospiraceae bacterium]
MDAGEIIKNKMYDHDAFSQWLGIKILSFGTGSCLIEMVVRGEMTNGFGIAHGGISYAFADSALAFASNSHGFQAVSIETSISHLKAIQVGDCLQAQATEKARTRKTALYEVEVKNQEGTLVALFKGTVFIKDKQWV